MASELRVDRIIPTTGVPTGGGGGVIQIVQASTSTEVTINTQTYTDTGLSATITPRFASSKILMITNHQVYAVSDGNNDFYWGIRYLRDSTTIYTPVSDGTGPYDFGNQAYGASTTRTWYNRCVPPQFLDSPNTTSTCTYKLHFLGDGGGRSATINRPVTNPGDGYNTPANTTLTLMEIAG